MKVSTEQLLIILLNSVSLLTRDNIHWEDYFRTVKN